MDRPGPLLRRRAFLRAAAAAAALPVSFVYPDRAGRPDASFVYLQEHGLTLAITGPFPVTRGDGLGIHSFEPQDFLTPARKYRLRPHLS